MPLSKAKEYFNLGTTLASEGEFDKALDYFRKSKELDPQFLDTYNNEGLVYVKLKSNRTTISGLPAYKVVFENSFMVAQEKFTLKSQEIWTIHEEKWYDIKFGTLDWKYDKYLPTFVKMINSLEIS